MDQPMQDAHAIRGNQRKRVQMSASESHDFLREHIGDIIMSTILPDGSIHSVAMWYGFVGDKIGVTTKAKSQKVLNIRRDPRMTLLVATGLVYEELRGVELIGTAEVVDDPAILRTVVLSTHSRRTGQPISEIGDDFVEKTLRNRVAIVHTANRVASWDHRKLVLPS